MSAEKLSALIERLESATQRLEAVSQGSGGGGGATPTAIVAEYDEFISQCIDPFVAASNNVPCDDVKQAAALVKQLAQEQKKFLGVASTCSAPTVETLGKLLQPLSSIMTDIGSIKSKAFKNKEFGSYVISINEGVMAFSWVSVSPAPAPFVKECKNSAQFYANKVLKDNKDKDWVAKWLGIFDPLHDYVKKHHTTGTSWNKDCATAVAPLPASLDSSPAKPQVPPKPEHLKQPKTGQLEDRPAPPKRTPPTPDQYSEMDMLPPPPPSWQDEPKVNGAMVPPPPPPLPPKNISADTEMGGTVGNASKALFSEINAKGLDIGSGLKKVTDDMKTHKNPNLRLQSAVPYKSPAQTKSVAAAKPKAAVTKPPKCELQGKKWVVEYQNDRSDLVITDALMKQTVYIFKCNNCTIQVKGKVNSIILDNCKKTGICFDTVVSGVEFVNCQSVKGQVTGLLPTASIEKTDGCQLYLNKKAINCQVISAKSSEMNVCILDDNGDYTEYPIIEQFRTSWCEKSKTFVTEVNTE